MLRVPSRAVFISNLALIVVAYDAVRTILETSTTKTAARGGRFSWPVTLSVVLVAVGVSASVWMMTGNIPLEMAMAPAVFVLALSLLILIRVGKVSAHLGGGMLIAFLVLDLGIVNHSGIDHWSLSRVSMGWEAAADYLSGRDDIFRIYSPSYSIPQHVAALYGLQLADGIDPLQLQGYAAYMHKATGVDVPGYSVTLPSFRTGQPEIDNRDAVPDADMLGRLNVRFVVSAFDIAAQGLVPVARFGDTRIYENTGVYPRMWVQTGEQITRERIKPVTGLRINRDQISARASGPGIVVASEIMYPGWRVTVDGQPEKILTADGIFRAVRIPKGEHEIRFYFAPISVYSGGIIGLITWLGLGMYFLIAGRSKRS
jgi:hypothetical protein